MSELSPGCATGPEAPSPHGGGDGRGPLALLPAMGPDGKPGQVSAPSSDAQADRPWSRARTAEMSGDAGQLAIARALRVF